MDAQSVASMQKQLRSAYDDEAYGPSVVKHMQKVEDFSAEATQREAFRKARSQGYLKFLYNGTMHGTRLKTETRQEHARDMLERAKSAAGPEVVGMPGDESPPAGMPDDFGGELPMAESNKINIEQLDKLIIEEMKKVKGKDAKRMLFENWRDRMRKRLAKKNNCEPPTNPNFRQRRANWRRFKKQYKLKKGQWPHDAFPAFSVKGPDGKNDDRASFEKFYAAVQKDKCAYIALGGLRKIKPIGKYPFDFKFGDQHSDAYSQLNVSTRATGGVELGDKAAADLAGGGTLGGVNNKVRFFNDELAYNIASYEKYSRMGEKNRDKIIDLLSKLKAFEKALASIEARSQKIRAEKFEGGARAPQGTGGGPGDPRVDFLQRRKQWQAERSKKLRELGASYDSHAQKRDEIGKELTRLRRPGQLAKTRAGMAKDIAARRSLARKKLAKAKELDKKLRDYFNTVKRLAPRDKLNKYSPATQKIINDLGRKIAGLKDAMNDLRNNQDVDLSRFEHP